MAFVIIEILSQNRKPWIATLKPPKKNRHAVIVDRVEDGKVILRDPWEKTMALVKSLGLKP
nr:hypothetical protein [uncultured Psychroserpens sp.]